MTHESKFLISLVSFLLVPLCTSISTIIPNHSIKDGDLLVSEGKSFALGFFSPGKSSNRYVGIWYNNIPEQTIVWVANRDNPINGSTGVLSINTAGNLAIHDSNKKVPIWSTNVSVATTGNSTYSAQLLDSGNLVLFHGDLDSKVIAWQSFDYPSNTLLPYMKLGVDRKAGLNRFLTSWKSKEDPGTGEYFYKIDVTMSPPQLFLYKGLVPYWRTGHWNGLMWSGVPHMMNINTYMFNVTYIENKDEVFVADYLVDASIISRMIVNEFGLVQRLMWHNASRWFEYYSAPEDLCDYYNHCGPYGNCDNSNPLEFECKCLPGYEPRSIHDWNLKDGSGGCMLKRGSNTCHSREGFVKVTRGKLPDTSMAMVNKSVGLGQCEEECLRNCSCTGYAAANISKGSGTGCLTWHGKLVDTREYSNGGQDFYLRVDAVELAEYLKSQQSDHGKKGILAKILAPSAAAVVFVTILLFYCLVVRKKKVSGTGKRGLFSSNANSTSVEASTYDKLFDESGTNTDLPFFNLSTIVAATDNFSFVNKLGQGGFGSVYKGQLHNGQEIAVKRLAKNSGQGAQEFKNEVTLIAKLQHRNLVRLLGFCVEQEEKMLIYEYLPNKGLDSFIFDKNSRSSIDWRKRFDIVMGIARGLLYLHQDSRLRIIHRDLKASNVLLDGAMNPKISDFGMARIFGGDQIEANTNRVVGTYGYMAPEYAMEGLFSMKSDVFSFGVLLLEIISGRKNSSYYQDNSVNLIGHAWSLWKEDKALQVVDPLLGNSYLAHEVFRCLHVGFLCVQESAVDRPTMSHVAFMLSHEITLPSPNQPAFTLKTRIVQDSSSGSVGSSSVNDLTLSVVTAR